MEGKNHLQLHDKSGTYPVEEVQAFLSDDLEVINNNRMKFIPEEENHEFDGSVKIMQTTKIPFKSASSDELAMLGIAIDITDTKEREIEFEKQYSQLQKHSIEIDYLNLELEEFQHEIADVMLNMLEIHDPYTKGHSENVANLGRSIAIELGLSEEDIQHTYWAGILHDIGKTVVPKEILNKKGKLCEKEYALIQNHSYWGYQVLRNSKQLNKFAKYVLYHHERWDSQGYPMGLESEEIPLIAQILSVADFWDALTSDRSYRLALSDEEALVELKLRSGTCFNPEIVSVFLQMKSKEDNSLFALDSCCTEVN